MSRQKNRGARPGKIVAIGRDPEKIRRELRHKEERAQRIRHAMEDLYRRLEWMPEGMRETWEAEYRRWGGWLDIYEAEIAKLYCELNGEAAP